MQSPCPNRTHTACSSILDHKMFPNFLSGTGLGVEGALSRTLTLKLREQVTSLNLLHPQNATLSPQT